MRKLLGTIAIFVILLIGFFGVRINDYQVEPFIKNWLAKNVEKVDVKEAVVDTITENIIKK